MAFEKDPNELGCLWAKESPRGEYMTGEIAGQPVVCFRVKSDHPKAPTWRVLKSQPRDGQPRRPAPRDEVPPPTEDDFNF